MSLDSGKCVNKFAMKLYSKLTSNDPDSNIFYSPASICLAIAMTYAGAKGETAKEVEGVMNWKKPGDVHEMMKQLQQSLKPSSADAGIKLDLANRLWAQSGFQTLEEFVKVLQDYYQAELGVLDFATQTESARKDINDWVSEKTNGKINELLAQGTLTSLTRLVLTNAIYFKGFWESQFEPSNTEDSLFKVTAEKKSSVKMMNQTTKFFYAENSSLSCQVLKLDYKSGNVAMLVLLPKKDDGLAELEKKINCDIFLNNKLGLQRRKVIVSLPKFKIDCQFHLNETLQKLGIQALFTNEADLSGMTGKRDLYVTNVVHQAFVDVNEEGSEAAAATAVVMNLRCAMPRLEEPARFIADHPFMFVIQHCDTGAILFMGKVFEPGKYN